MARLDRYMLSQLMMLFGFFALILILVYWVNRAVRLFDQLIADGQSFRVFLELSALTLPSIIWIILPIATFAASVYVTNRMMTDSEMVVVQATGFSSYRIARPVIYFGILMSLVMALLVHVLVPTSRAGLKERQAEIAQNATARLLREGQFMSPIDGVTIYISEVSPQGELRNIMLTDSRAASEIVTYTASNAFIVRTDAGPQLVMVDGLAQTYRPDSRSLVTTSFNDLAYNLGTLVSLPDPDKRSMREVLTPELLFPTPALIAETGQTAAELVSQAHMRFARTLQPMVSALIGFATLLMGGFSRFGVWRQILAAIFLLIAVKIVESAVTSVISGAPEMWILHYTPETFGLLVAFGLLGWKSRPTWLRWRSRPSEVAA